MGISAEGLNQGGGRGDKLSEATWDVPSLMPLCKLRAALAGGHTGSCASRLGELCYGRAGKKLPWIPGDEGLEKPVPCLEHTLDLLWRWVSLKRLDGENFRNVSFFLFFIS